MIPIEPAGLVDMFAGAHQQPPDVDNKWMHCYCVPNIGECLRLGNYVMHSTVHCLSTGSIETRMTTENAQLQYTHLLPIAVQLTCSS